MLQRTWTASVSFPRVTTGHGFRNLNSRPGAELGEGNSLSVTGLVRQEKELPKEEGGGAPDPLKPGTDWMPLIFSANESVEADVVFAGYGIVAPEVGDQPGYDSYADLDVKDKWVLAYRFVPEDITAERRQHLKFYANLRKKAFHAREQRRGRIAYRQRTKFRRERSTWFNSKTTFQKATQASR